MDRVNLFLRIVTEYVKCTGFIKVRSVDVLFNIEMTEKKFFCMFLNIFGIKEYLDCLTCFGTLVNREKIKQLVLNLNNYFLF